MSRKRRRRGKKISPAQKEIVRETVLQWKQIYRRRMKQLTNEEIVRVLEEESPFFFRKKHAGFTHLSTEFLTMVDKGAYQCADLCDKVYLRDAVGGGYITVCGLVRRRIRNYMKDTLLQVRPELTPKLLDACVLEISKRYLEKDYKACKPDDRGFIDCILKNKNLSGLAFVQRRSQMIQKIPEDMTLLYPEARELNRHFIFHVGDTNTGKTYDAIETLAAAESGVYLAPLRLLALEGQEILNGKGVRCSMLTGEEEDMVEDASHISCTVEMLDTGTYYDVAVIDEAQMAGDRDRGFAWTNAILGCYSPLIHVCMSENALNLVSSMVTSCGDTYEVVRHERNTPLYFESEYFTFPDSVRSGDALILFSRKDVLAAAGELERAGFHPSVVYGSLPYNARKEEMRRFHAGETDIVVATDAIGMGVNMPIHRIVFLRSGKFDGVENRPLTVPEVRQIAGRAGRRGIFNEGYVNAAVDRFFLKKQLESNYTDLEYAGIQIPETLFALPMKLSEILKEWAAIADNGLYRKVANDYRIRMCIWLEEHCPQLSKESMWTLLSVPYDENDEQLRAQWMTLSLSVAENTAIDSSFLPRDLKQMDLNECEQYYRELDLYFGFARIFGLKYAGFREWIADEKAAVADAISEKLKESKGENVKTCKACGRELSVMYPYRECQECFEKRKILFREREKRELHD